MWLLYFSSRNRFYINDNVYNNNAIFVFWHGEFLMLPFLYRKIRKNPKIFVISSEHFDGELMVKLYSYFGFKSIRGSSSKGGRRVLIQAFSKLKEGFDTAITPDGPKGPYHSIADGVVAMAQKTGVNVVVLQTISSKFWQLKTWDKFIIPKPFASIKYYALEPFKLDSNLTYKEAKELVYKKMTQPCF
ncbi:lysophospholipid acyltransferase family protein [Helicobacter sp. MIT 14-3879]|uniref:lysophospholipid acyltransferase family protein n=1 Tax=Helicobacter sp. MIT 14-3879 TaxID=2040649 RepID=UPI002162876D|nr:lysophospholipid acyltransferase family protein [Helicobacter sp. MIT 14-3879]